VPRPAIVEIPSEEQVCNLHTTQLNDPIEARAIHKLPLRFLRYQRSQFAACRAFDVVNKSEVHSDIVAKFLLKVATHTFSNRLSIAGWGGDN